jgi:hypothetical protein
MGRVHHPLGDGHEAKSFDGRTDHRDPAGAGTQARKNINRAHEKFVEAQNNLVRKLNTANQLAREEFEHFYRCGGVTAEDWERFFDENNLPLVESIEQNRARPAEVSFN